MLSGIISQSEPVNVSQTFQGIRLRLAAGSGGGRDESSHLALKDTCLDRFTMEPPIEREGERSVHLSYALRCNRDGHHHHHPGFTAQSQIPALISTRLLYSNHLTHLDIFGWTARFALSTLPTRADKALGLVAYLVS